MAATMQEPQFPPEAVVCVGDPGINGLATVRSLGRRGVRVRVVALESSAQIASLSRYCAAETRVADFGVLYHALWALPAHPQRALLFIDNDKMMKALAPYAAQLQQRFRVVEPLAQAGRFMDKVFQLQAAADAGIAVPRTWTPNVWEDIAAIAAQTGERLLAKPSPARFPAGVNPSFKAIVAPSAAELERQLRSLVASAADVLVQEYIEGDETCHYGSLSYRARNAEACFVLTTRKVRQTSLEAGIMAVGRVVDAPEVREMTRRLLERLDYRGVVHVEFKRSPRDGKYYFIEWNARPPYFHSVGWKAGFDGAWFAYCDHVAPQALDSVRLRQDARHHWISLSGDVKRLLQAPRLALRPDTWAPYVQRKEWAVFTLDDPKPWWGSMRQLTAWLWQGAVRTARRRLGRRSAALGARSA
jgi:D-aspartate ligase